MTDANHTTIIAEAGVNHNGSLERALALVDAAALAGADYVKFQTFRADKLVTGSARRADYQRANMGGGNDDSQLAMLRGLQLEADDFAALAARCAEQGIGFMSTPFDFDSIVVLSAIGQDYWKIPSGEITNTPYLEAIASLHRPVIMSTGMSTLDEVRRAVDTLTASGLTRDMITLLHCTTMYPTPFADVNLRAMEALRSLGCAAVGYSDHTPGTAIAVAAVALGASVIEKHFTLDRNLPGPDHKASLEPDELARMVSDIRATEVALGTPVKRPTQAEIPNIAVARKSIVASQPIAAGTLFTAGNLTTKRPGTGLSPVHWHELVGHLKATRDYLPDEPIDAP